MISQLKSHSLWRRSFTVRSGTLDQEDLQAEAQIDPGILIQEDSRLLVPLSKCTFRVLLKGEREINVCK